jgi:hypothetical protein
MHGAAETHAGVCVSTIRYTPGVDADGARAALETLLAELGGAP